MALHVNCGPIAPQPRRYPLFQPEPEQHGITSNLCQTVLFHQNIASSARGSLGEESPRSLYAQPTSNRPTFAYPDPQLCVTPEKGQLRHERSARTASRVQFDCSNMEDDVLTMADIDGKGPIETKLGPDPDLDLSAQVDPNLYTTPQLELKTTQQPIELLSSTEQLMQRASALQSQVSGLMNRMETLSVDSETLGHMGYALRPSHSLNTRSLEEALALGQAESTLARPEYNTTLRLKAEIERTRAQCFDEKKARKSRQVAVDQTATSVSNAKPKNMSGVEVTRPLFEGVTSVDISFEDISSKSANRKKKRKPLLPKQGESSCEEPTKPEPSEFCTSELLRPDVAEFSMAPLLRLSRSGTGNTRLSTAVNSPRLQSSSTALQQYNRKQFWIRQLDDGF